MFKLENYITPIILSYVDKYIKNFRPEDSQVSLWGGDVSFHNLDLRLEVLEEELKLPFSFVSGHIHELLIHVPWTKLASEPITITINTIECILKLRGAPSDSDGASSTSGNSTNSARDSRRKSTTRKQELEAPPGYIQSLINKIVGNICINCNNLILKYVEEDIVVSMNIKLLTIESADQKWQAAFSDVSPTHVVIRKLITLTDLTVCLDRRNAAGKIDVYQEPMLYRCSLEIRLMRMYHNATAQKASTTRIDVHCNSMEFSMSSQQVPMLMRLIMLVQALQSKELKKEIVASSVDTESVGDAISDDHLEVGWAGWAWSLVPTLLPVWDEEWSTQQDVGATGHSFHLGVYIDNAVLSFKVSESSNEKTFYAPRKLKYWPVLSIRLSGCFVDVFSHGRIWTNVQSGIARATLRPAGSCTCGAEEVLDMQPQDYFRSTIIESACYWRDSLLDPESPENKGIRRIYNISWDKHISTVTESYLLGRSPALAFDLLYHIDPPEDFQSDSLSELGSDLEYSNLSEKSLIRLIIGPFVLKYCAGLVHRLEALKQAADMYDYAPYSEPKPMISLSDIPPPSSEDFDALNENVPTVTLQITAIRPAVELLLWDHDQKKSHKKIQALNQPSSNITDKVLPLLRIEIEYLDAKITSPMYCNRLVFTTCKLPNPPQKLMDACFKKTEVKLRGLSSHLIIKEKTSTIVLPAHLTFTGRQILMDQYWLDKDICLHDFIISIENISLTGTKPKNMIVCYILNSIINSSMEEVYPIFDTTLLFDAYRDISLELFELTIEDIFGTYTSTICTQSFHLSVGSVKAFILEKVIPKWNNSTQEFSVVDLDNKKVTIVSKPKQVIILSGPECEIKSTQSLNSIEPLLSATVQLPIKPGVPDHPALVIFKLAELRLSLDPILCHWLLYTPKLIVQRSERPEVSNQQLRRRISEASGGSLDISRRTGPQPTSVHSNSERPIIHQPISPNQDKCDIISLEEANVFGTFFTWFQTWNCLLIQGDIDQMTFYLPTTPMLALESQNIQESLLSNSNSNPELEVLIISFPFISIRGTGQKQNLNQYICNYPIKLPENVWSDSKKSFPWNISIWDLSCYTIQQKKKLFFIKPVSCNATIAVSTKNNAQITNSSSKSKITKSKTKFDNISESSSEANNLNSKPRESPSLPDITPGKVPSLVRVFNNQPAFAASSSNNRDEFESIGICIHVDTMPICIGMSETQVMLISNIISGLLEVRVAMFPPSANENLPSTMRAASTQSPAPTTPPEMGFQESTQESSVSATSKSGLECIEAGTDAPKVTMFIQWTLARLSTTLYGNDNANQLKLLFEMEDIVSSLDMQSVYVKLKAKLATASIQHFQRQNNSQAWSYGPYLGLVMMGRETSLPSSEEHCFASMTITKAKCRNVHRRWGANKKSRSIEEQTPLIKPNYLTEIMITMQSVDFVLSPKTLSSFILVLNPLRCIMVPYVAPKQCNSSASITVMRPPCTTATLPLVYIDVRGLRIILPASDATLLISGHDVLVFQVDHINLSPSAKNPICRVPVRPDIYQQAAQAGLLNIPGSEIEDRQYQLTAVALSVSTTLWLQLEHCLRVESTSFTLRTMNENPALEWNNLDNKKAAGVTLQPSMIPIIKKFDLCTVAAPAMIHKNTVVCGHSIEIDCVSDLEMNICTSQLILTESLFSECYTIIETTSIETSQKRRPKTIYQYDTESINEDELRQFNEFHSDQVLYETSHVDSGVDLGDVSSDNITLKTFPSSGFKRHLKSEPVSFPFLSKRLSEKPTRTLLDMECFVPLDVLFTGGNFALQLYHKGSCETKNMCPPSSRNSLASLERGYEASEEESIADDLGINAFYPLLHVFVCQPNLLVNYNIYDSKIQMSVYDVRIAISPVHHMVLRAGPCSGDFTLVILDTRPGQCHPTTGILPAFLTLKRSSGIGKADSLEVIIARPIKIHASVDRWQQLSVIHKQIISCLKIDQRKQCNNQPNSTEQSMKIPSSYTQFDKIRSNLMGISHLKLTSTQAVLDVNIRDNLNVNVGFTKVQLSLLVNSRPEKIQTNLMCDNLTFVIWNKSVSKRLLNPWSFECYINLFWENWQLPDADPIIQINIESDSIILDVGPDHIIMLEDISKHIQDLLSPDDLGDKHYKQSETIIDSPPNLIPVDTRNQSQDQHYKDDLRAGAFQFVDATVGEEIPLPYQVLFWSSFSDSGTMAWRYPQPRALTRIHIFPVPFQVRNDDVTNEAVYCQLEYYSETHGSYLPYIQFQLSESNMLKLNMPNQVPELAVSSIWRVILSSEEIDKSMPRHRTQSKSEIHVKNNIDSGLMVSPRALAVCMRIDSFFGISLVPSIKAVVNVTSIQLNLFNHFNNENSFKLAEPLSHFCIDDFIPENQEFLNLKLDSFKVYICTWKDETALLDVKTNIKCDILDYAFLTKQSLISLFAGNLNIGFSDTISINVVSKPIEIKFGPSAMHTLVVSQQLWSQSFTNRINCTNSNSNVVNPSISLIVMTRYVICNDTNLALWFGQAGTDESILLASRSCNLYVWRSQKFKQFLRIGIKDNDDFMWSKAFEISENIKQTLTFNPCNSMTLLVIVEALSSTQKLVTFSGQLMVCNMLTERFEMKVLPINVPNKDQYLKQCPTHILYGRSTAPSQVLDSVDEVAVRLRFQGLDSNWSGDIPLRENTKTCQPWLVKVPLQERSQFLSVWCRIIREVKYDKVQRILIALWPLYMIRSHLPMPAKVQVDTPSMDVHLQTTIAGRGCAQQLYCPGTIDHSHKLTFHLENDVPESNPYVPLNYSLVDQKEFFKRTDVTIDEMIKVFQDNQKVNSDWPFEGEEFGKVKYMGMDQPQTNVTVRYQPFCPNACSLLLELLPWCMMLNSLGCTVAIASNFQDICEVAHHGVITPPKLEDTFILRVYLDATWYSSTPLQLSVPDSLHSFYMPKIIGLIPTEGYIRTAIMCNSTICNVTISSEIYQDIRIIRICSSHVICNATNQTFRVLCYAIRSGIKWYSRPFSKEFGFEIMPAMDIDGIGIPITQWMRIQNLDEIKCAPGASNHEYNHFISLSLCDDPGMSCPIKVDGDSLRRSISVPCNGYSIPVLLLSHLHKGQTYITIESDPNPQLLIVNETNVTLLCAQSAQNASRKSWVPVPDCVEIEMYTTIVSSGSAYFTMPGINDRFPEIQQKSGADLHLIIAACIEGMDGLSWSIPISVTQANELSISLPNCSDMKVIVKPNCHTTIIKIQTINEVVICAGEIRSRLISDSNEVLCLPSISGINSEAQTVCKVVESNEHDVTCSLYVQTSSNASIDRAVPPQLPRLLSTILESSNSSSRAIVTSAGLLQNYQPDSVDVLSKSPSDSRTSNSSMSCKTNYKFSVYAVAANVFIKSFNVVLMTDLEECGIDRTELASITLDNIAISVDPKMEELKVHITMGGMQIDNQLFNRGGYDFPVVMLGQNVNHDFNVTCSDSIRILKDLQDKNTNTLISVKIVFEIFDNLNINSLGVRDVTVKLNPLTVYVEDNYCSVIVNYIDKFSTPNLNAIMKTNQIKELNSSSTYVCVPEHILVTSKMLSRPVKIQKLTFEPLEVLLSVHSSIRLYIALDHSPLYFGNFEKRNLLTTPFKLGHAVAMHYLSGAIFGAGWVVGSLEILGSPSGLARSLGTGLKDFVQMPYLGLMLGPWEFLVGVTQGSASLMKNITAGTVNSVTKMAASVARNLDRLALDDDHYQRTEELRRIRPQGLSQGLIQGLTGLGISLLGAVGGIAHHPLTAQSPSGAFAGVGRAIVGAITKPLSGAAELLALAGQGLLQGTGWSVLPQARTTPKVQQLFGYNNSNVKYPWKILPGILAGKDLIYVTDATCIIQNGNYEAVALILTTKELIIVGLENDVCQRYMCLSELKGAPDSGDPTLVCFKLVLPDIYVPTIDANNEAMDIQMDPDSRARVAQYIRSSNSLRTMLQSLSDSQSDLSVSPLQSLSENSDNTQRLSYVTFLIDPQSRNHFLKLFSLVKKQDTGFGFPIF